MRYASQDGRPGGFGLWRHGLGRRRGAGAAGTDVVRVGRGDVPAVPGAGGGPAGALCDGLPGRGAAGGEEHGGAAGRLPGRGGEQRRAGRLRPAPARRRGPGAGRQHRLGPARSPGEAIAGRWTAAARGGGACRASGEDRRASRPDAAGPFAERAGGGPGLRAGGPGGADPRAGGPGRGPLAHGGDGAGGLRGGGGRGALLPGGDG